MENDSCTGEGGLVRSECPLPGRRAIHGEGKNQLSSEETSVGGFDDENDDGAAFER